MRCSPSYCLLKSSALQVQAEALELYLPSLQLAILLPILLQAAWHQLHRGLLQAGFHIHFGTSKNNTIHFSSQWLGLIQPINLDVHRHGNACTLEIFSRLTQVNSNALLLHHYSSAGNELIWCSLRAADACACCKWTHQSSCSHRLL